jgi:DNA polymerase V
MHIGDVWGIGRRLTSHLNRLGIRTALDLRNADPSGIRRRFNVVAERTVWELRGRSCLTLEEVEAPRKSLMVSRSFGRKITALRQLQAAVATHASRAAAKLRQGRQTAEAIEVFAHTSRFDQRSAPYWGTGTVALPRPTADTRLIVAAALEGLDALFRQGPRYAKAGVMLLGLRQPHELTAPLFSGLDQPVDHSLMRLMDRLNRDYGRNALFIAASRSGNAWLARHDRKSAAFTTRWEELRNVRG